MNVQINFSLDITVLFSILWFCFGAVCCRRKKDHGRAEGLLISAWGCGLGLVGRNNFQPAPDAPSAAAATSTPSSINVVAVQTKSRKKKGAASAEASTSTGSGVEGAGQVAAAGPLGHHRAGVRVPLPGSPDGQGVQLLYGSLRKLGVLDGYGNLLHGEGGGEEEEDGEQGELQFMEEAQPPKRGGAKKKSAGVKKEKTTRKKATAAAAAEETAVAAAARDGDASTGAVKAVRRRTSKAKAETSKQ